MKEWKTYKIRDIATVNLSQYSLKEGWNEVTYLDTGSITENHIEDIQTFILPCDDFPSRARRKVQHNDILFSTVRPNQKHFGILKNPNDNLLVSTGFSVITVNPLVADANFVYYYITQQEIINYLQSVAEQSVSAYPSLKSSDIEDIDIELPSLYEQRRLALILKSIDDKIENNNRINHNLEQQAQAIYKSWFVDFEPFRDGKFVESELGMIPEGWRVAELGTVTRQSSQKVKDRTDVKVLSPITTGELVLSEEYFTKQVFSESISKYIVVKPLHFAYNPARVNIGSIGMNMFSFDGCVSPVYVVFECEKGYHHFFDYYRKTASFKDEVLNRAIGGVRQTLSYKDFALIKLVYPPYDIVEKFNCIYAGLLENKNSIKREISKLSELRDTLLPKLLSGELKINDLTC